MMTLPCSAITQWLPIRGRTHIAHATDNTQYTPNNKQALPEKYNEWSSTTFIICTSENLNICFLCFIAIMPGPCST